MAVFIERAEEILRGGVATLCLEEEILFGRDFAARGEGEKQQCKREEEEAFHHGSLSREHLGEEQGGEVEGGVEGDGGQEGVLTLGQKAEPEADEEEGQKEGVGAVGKGEEDCGGPGCGAAAQGIEECAAIEEFLSQRAESADEGEQGEGLERGEGADQADGALGGTIGGNGNKGPGPGNQADGVADEDAQAEGWGVRRTPGEDVAQTVASAGKKPGDSGQEEERKPDGLRKEQRREGGGRRWGGRLRGEVGEAEEEGDGEAQREGEDAQQGLAEVNWALRHVTGRRGRPG